MKIAIFSPTSTILSLKSDQPLGGADQALLKMIYALSDEGHNVIAFIPVKEATTYKNIGEHTTKIYPYMDAFNCTEPLDVDVLILYRKIWALPPQIKFKKCIFYSQDSNETPCFDGQHKTTFKEVFDQFNKIIVLSRWHRENLKEAFQLPQDKFVIIGNGADPQDKVEKIPFDFIYASTPYRGLVVLAKMWKKIREYYPTARLHVFSSMKIYGAEHLDRIHFDELYNKLQRMDGIIYHGTTSQAEMIECMKKCSLLLYPNTYPETFCNVLMEARACYTPFITSNKGALKETGGLTGLYIDGDPYTQEYQEKFIAGIDYMLYIRDVYEEAQAACYPIRSWNDHAREINDLMEVMKE